MNNNNVYQNIDTGVLMSANDYNCLSDAQKERMRIYKKDKDKKPTSLSISNRNWLKTEIQLL